MKDKQLQSTGFTVGTRVVRKDKAEGLITGFQQDKVKLTMNGKDVWSNADTFLQGQWKGKAAVKTKEGSQEIAWIKHSQSEEFVLNTVRALLS